MILADKLILLRKKNAWSQEELANKLDVSRQAVSKWEGAQSTPDLEKIIKLSEIFNVSTDYLLKDNLEFDQDILGTEDNTIGLQGESRTKEESLVRWISMEEASEFLSIKKKNSKKVSYAVFLCIISSITLIVLSSISENNKYLLSENLASGIGLSVLFIFISIAIAIFMSSSSKSARFDFLEKETFKTSDGVTSMVNKYKEDYREKYSRNNIIASIMCVLGALPIIIGSLIDGEDEVFISIMLSFTLIIVGVAVLIFVKNGIIWTSFEKLLEEGDYSKEKKEEGKKFSNISTAYWLIATAIYLAYSFISYSWALSWIVWPVAGVLYPAMIAILKLFTNKK